MKILHVSDTHSAFIILPKEWDFMIHSGDFLPNFHFDIGTGRRNLSLEIEAQEQWVEENVDIFKWWLQDRPFLFSAGNHDFIDPCPILQAHGINAISLTNQFVTFEGLTFYGYPYVPALPGRWAGFWNYECSAEGLKNTLDDMIKVTGSSFDILVAHAPPFGILDMTHSREHIGNTALINYLDYDVLNVNYILSGHVHESAGRVKYNNTVINQSACRASIVEM